MELVLHPPSYGARVAPQGREEIAPLHRALPDRGLEAAGDCARLLEGALQVLAELRVAVF
jgi:hypothetical protein